MSDEVERQVPREWGELTADEIAEFDNHLADGEAAQKSLEVAINYHSNQVSRLSRDSRKLWGRVAARLGFELSDDVTKQYRLAKRRGAVVIVEFNPLEPSDDDVDLTATLARIERTLVDLRRLQRGV